jgi:hypothetical protein
VDYGDFIGFGINDRDCWFSGLLDICEKDLSSNQD